MATTTEALIFAALAGRVNTLSLTPALPIAWPNVNYAPPADGKYLAVSFIPNMADRLGIPGSTAHRYIGILQISVWWPKGRGVEPLEKAGLVAAHFTPDLKLTSGAVTVRIRKDPDVAAMLVEDHAVQIPVSIDWEAFA